VSKVYLSRRLYALVLAGFCVLLVVFALALSLLVLRDGLRDRLARAGFADSVDVRLVASEGVVVRGLRRAAPLRAGPVDLQLDVDSIRVPLDLEGILRMRRPVVGRIEVRGVRLTLLRARRSGGAPSGAAPRGMLSALPQLCPAGCRVDLEDVRVEVRLEGLDLSPIGRLHGAAQLSSEGRFDAELRGDDGRTVSLRLGTDDPVATLEVHVLRPGRARLAIAGGAAGALQLDVGAQAAHVGPGEHVHLAGVEATLGAEGAVLARVRAGLVALGAGTGTWCVSGEWCFDRADDVLLEAQGAATGFGPIAVQLRRAEHCGAACLALLGVGGRLEHARGSALVKAERVRASAFEAFSWPGTLELTRLEVQLRRAPAAVPSVEAQGADAEEETPERADPLSAVASTLAALDEVAESAQGSASAWLAALSRRSPGGSASLRADDVWVDLVEGDTATHHLKLSGLEASTGQGAGTHVAAAFELHRPERAPADGQLGLRLEGENPARGELALRLDPSGGVDLSAQLRLGAIVLEHPKVADAPVRLPGLSVEAVLRRQPVPGGAHWLLPAVRARLAPGVSVDGRAGLVLLHEEPDAGAAWLDLDVPEQGCAELFAAVPEALREDLRGALFEGVAAFGLSAGAELGSLRSLDLDLQASVERCRPHRLGRFRVKRLLHPGAVFKVRDPKLDSLVRVGPGTDNWIPLDYLPAHVWGAALATEDMRFFEHQGFAPGLIRRALILNLERERYVYGGSTITQQLVKNIFLDRRKTLSRKLQEAVLVWAVEREVPKRRILELYLNCIEFGPELYGVDRAARRYFGREASELLPVESAFLMALKPDPLGGYDNWRRRRVTKWWRKRMDTIRRRLLSRSWVVESLAAEMDPERVFERAAPAPERAWSQRR